MPAAQDILAELHAIRTDIATAADGLLFAAETGLARAAQAKAGDDKALDDVTRLFCAILEACAFQDITGQRLTRIEQLLSGDPARAGGLLNGPAGPGLGLQQADADALFSSTAADRQIDP